MPSPASSKAVAAKNATISIENRLAESDAETTSSMVSVPKMGSPGSAD